MQHEHDDGSACFEVIERLPLSPFAALATYLTAIIAVVTAFGPIAGMIWLTNGRAADAFEMVFALLALAWPVAFVIILEARQIRFLEATTSSLPEERSRSKRRRRDARRRLWNRCHVLPEPIFTAAMALCAIPGFLLAQSQGWGHEPAKAASACTGLFGLGLLAAVDSWLMHCRRSKLLKGDAE